MILATMSQQLIRGIEARTTSFGSACVGVVMRRSVGWTCGRRGRVGALRLCSLV